jgi:uncharacterized protein YegJ (DUF2314 family)
MSESQSPTFSFDNDDPDMQRAYKSARKTFRYFWRECSWERRRIIPGLDLAAVKAPFFDGTPDDPGEVEHMWLNEIDFDGRVVTGVLLNQPNQVTSVSAGDPVSVPLDRINDWMYGQLGEVYGGHTVQLMRSRMGRRERKEHDEAWGLNFGDPDRVRIVPEIKKKGGLFGMFRKGDDDGEIGEHPMSENMAPELAKQLKSNPDLLTSRDERGWTLLHTEALAGSYSPVKVLLEAGADRKAKTNDGRTPLDLARALKWERVVGLLERRE